MIKKLLSDPKVTVKTDEIGGPSAGLMFSLEIYNQLTKEDFTKGYKIAGTGTIDSKGTVGPIGGIDKKLLQLTRQEQRSFLLQMKRGQRIPTTSCCEDSP